MKNQTLHHHINGKKNDIKLFGFVLPERIKLNAVKSKSEKSK